MNIFWQMRSSRYFVLFLVLLLIGIVLLAAIADGDMLTQDQIKSPILTLTLPNPSIIFSPDNKIIRITYDQNKWSFYRPDTPPLTFNPSATGQTVWVDVNGDDNNSGVESFPFRTITHAAAVAHPGDIVYIKAGVYYENVDIVNSGSLGQPIIISAAPDAFGQVTVTPPSDGLGKSVIMVRNRAQYIWINGLIIEGTRGQAGAPTDEHFEADGITWANGAGLGDRATNNVVFNALHCGLKEMGHGGKGILIEGNIVFENGLSALDHGIYLPDQAVVDGNIVFNNSGYGIHSYPDPQNQRITRNVFEGNGEGGILLAGGYSIVCNNTVINNKRGVFYFRGYSEYNMVEDNIFAFNDINGAFDTDGGTSFPHNNVDDYNLYYSLTSSRDTKAVDSSIQLGRHILSEDPLFVSYLEGDVRLLSNSPAIGSGTPCGLPYSGVAPDLGALQSTPNEP